MSDLDLLVHRVRPAKTEHPAGALVLLHGRGANEQDLFPLIDVFDPAGRLTGVTPRAPLELTPGGYRWYVSGDIPHPDPETFLETYDLLGRWLAALARDLSINFSEVLIGGFSQGAVMSYAVTLGRDRPRPAGLMAFSGFIPKVDGFEFALDQAQGFPVAMGHGTMDTVIGAEWGRQAKMLLAGAGAEVLYDEAPMAHGIDPSFAAGLSNWVSKVIPDSA
ncbi:MAG: alpha/beta hydrolase [Actinomycetota bacterium]